MAMMNKAEKQDKNRRERPDRNRNRMGIGSKSDRNQANMAIGQIDWRVPNGEARASISRMIKFAFAISSVGRIECLIWVARIAKDWPADDGSRLS